MERKDGEMGKRRKKKRKRICKKIVPETGKTVPQFREIVT